MAVTKVRGLAAALNATGRFKYKVRKEIRALESCTLSHRDHRSDSRCSSRLPGRGRRSVLSSCPDLQLMLITRCRGLGSRSASVRAFSDKVNIPS